MTHSDRFIPAIAPVFGQAEPARRNHGGITGVNNQIEKILNSWNISQDLPVRAIDETDGVSYLGHIWFIGNKFVLKKHKPEERDALIKKSLILKALDEQGFSSAPLYTKDGAAYAGCAGEDSIYTLTRYIPGGTLTSDEISGENMPEYGRKIGQALAKLHLALDSLENEISVKDADMYKQVTEWAIPKVAKINSDFEIGLKDGLFDDYIQNFGKLHDKLPKQLIHRDSHPGNIIFSNGEVCGFIDFEIDERNIRLRDVCYFLTGIGGVFYDNPERWLEIIRETLSGYSGISPLTCEEKQSIFYVMCSIQLICLAYFAGKDIYKQAFEQNRKLTPFIAAHKKRICEIGIGIK